MILPHAGSFVMLSLLYRIIIPELLLFIQVKKVETTPILILALYLFAINVYKYMEAGRIEWYN